MSDAVHDLLFFFGGWILGAGVAVFLCSFGFESSRQGLSEQPRIGDRR